MESRTASIPVPTLSLVHAATLSIYSIAPDSSNFVVKRSACSFNTTDLGLGVGMGTSIGNR